jgi:transcriptional regulator with XRE-family HTH domain
MPRPPKHVPPETLGGRLRAARESLHLSLVHVAAGRYSTSLISQIERNRIEPSRESLQFLAERLHLPLEELQVLAQQQKETEVESRQHKVYEELRIEALLVLEKKRPQQSLELLKGLKLSHLPSTLRWRIAALRGQCHFALRQFLAAHKDLQYAVTEQPERVPVDQQVESMILRMHLAATLREIEQPDAAFEQYAVALKMMNSNTSLHYIAETHWGMSLIAFERASKSDCPEIKEAQFHLALQHAENAKFLYRSIGESLRASLLMCQIGLIEQATGQLEAARKQLLEILDTWMPELESRAQAEETEKRSLEEVANVISAAACSLAGIELDEKCFEQALIYAHQAKHAGKLSYILRRAEAEMMLGRILEAINIDDPAAEEAFRAAIKELAPTHRIAAQIRAYNLLGRHLLKKGEEKAGEKALDHALHLSHKASAFSSSTISADSENDDSSKPD